MNYLAYKKDWTGSVTLRGGGGALLSLCRGMQRMANIGLPVAGEVERQQRKGLAK